MVKQVSKLFALAALTAATSLAARAQAVTTQIAFPSSMTEGIAVDPFLNSIYVVTPSGYPNVDDTVSVIDGNTDTILKTIQVPVGVYYPAVNLLTDRVYVAGCNNYIKLSPCFVTVIDGRSNTVVTTIPITTVKNGFLAGITANPVTNLVYVSDNTDGTVVVIDGKTNTVKSTIALNAHPWGLTINPFNNLLYVTTGSSSIDIINGGNNTITKASTGAGTYSENVGVDLLSRHVFVVNTQFGPSSTVVLSATGTFIASALTGEDAYGVDVDPFTNLAFVASATTGNTDVVNGANNTAEVPIEGTSPFFISVNPFSQKVYTSGSGIVTVSTE